MSLLTPSESLAFQSFLSSIDPFADSASSEWSMYGQGIPDDIEIPPIQGKESLVKATKDLMALDDRWASAHDSGSYEPRQHHPSGDSHTAHHQPQLSSQQQSVGHALSHRRGSYRRDVFPFLTNKLHQAQNQHPHLHPISISPIPSMTPSPPASAQSSTSAAPSTTSSVTFSFPPNSSGPNAHTFASSLSPSASGPSKTLEPSPPPSASYLPDHHLSAQTSSAAQVQASNLKRSHPSSPHQHSYPIAPSCPATGTRHQTNQHHASSLSQHLGNSSNGRVTRPQVGQPSGSSAPQKQALLSPSQKKANHIQSEQKRRANIRRGYEALCDTVPALREAIRAEEEEEQAAAAAALATAGGSAQTKNTSTKRRRTKKLEVDGEKLDGRAGPRSENVVLSKTIDYINELLSERNELLARYHQARGALPPGHSAAVSLQTSMSDVLGLPLWEREWKGGESKEEDDNEEDIADDAFEDASS